MKPGIQSILPAVLLACLCLTGCRQTAPGPAETPADDIQTPIITETEEETMTKETEAIPAVPDKEEQAAEAEIPRTPIDWLAAIEGASARANGVQGRFTDAARKKFLVTNQKMTLLYDLAGDGHKGVEGMYGANGTPYFEEADVSILLPDGSRCSASYSPKNGRMNSHRLGYYYYDFRFCDQLFVNGEALAEAEEGTSYDIIARSGVWGTHDTSAVKKQDGVLRYTVTSDYDPYVYTTVRFDTEKYDAVEITMKTERAEVGEIFLIAGGHDGYSAEQRTSFAVTPGEWTTVTVPLAVIPDYTGTVRGFRLDFGAAADEVVEISTLRAVKTGASSAPFALERIFHTYSDKVHEVLRVVATNDFEGGGRFESEIRIPADTVGAVLFANAAGESADPDGFDFTTAEFVAFDIRDAGVWGVILPNTKNNGDIRVELRDGTYIVTRGIEMKTAIQKGGDVLFGHRLYASDEHDFDAIRREAYIERHPLTGIGLSSSSDDAKCLGYDPLAGCYRFSVRGSGFNRAYYDMPDKHYAVHAHLEGDGVYDRTIYLAAVSANEGCLECAAVLDENGVLLPIPVEVCKNFCGEFEEPLFDPEDPAYGEAYFPVSVGKDEAGDLTILHLYQNWGKYPLKQLSSIAFHIPYYHLSVGVTETNCIAPYFVFGKDAWTLPDFRANSAPLWSTQPQHTSAGRLYFLEYTDAEGRSSKSESQSAQIVSAGPVYADITMDYLSDDGRIRAVYRHTETAQTDENRTYYHIGLEVLDDISFDDFRRDFAFFTFDGRAVRYDKLGYLDESGAPAVENTEVGERVIVLGEDHPYYDYYKGNVTDSVNFALIVRSAALTVGGEPYDGRFVLYERSDKALNTGSLSLDLGEVTLKKGDRMELEIILLPWGYSTSRNDKNVLKVRRDSCTNPLRAAVLEGEAIPDSVIPSVRAKDGRASIALAGGPDLTAVRVYGFENRTLPRITETRDGEAHPLELAGRNGYDGYQVFRDPDGTYSFAFNVSMEDADEVVITVEAP